MPEDERVNNRVRCDTDSRAVVIEGHNVRHAASIVGYLRSGVLAKYVRESAVQVRLPGNEPNA